MRYISGAVMLFFAKAALCQVLFSSDFENESYSCWGYGNRDSNGFIRNSCNQFHDIGGNPIKLVGYGWFGFKQLEIAYEHDEEEGRASVTIAPQDVVYVRAYYIFYGQFDFPQGLKLGKVKGSAPGYGVFDIMLQGQAPISADYGTEQQGINDNVFLGLFHNNPFGGYDWGEVKGNQPLNRGHAYCIEYMVAMNTPGYHDGQVQVWVDGNSVASASNLLMRPSSDWKIEEVRFGSNYSNSAKHNPYPEPAYPSTYNLDEVVVSTSRIGCL